MRRADIEVPNLPVDGNSRGRSACYPQGSFYPMSDGLSIQHRRITRTDFRLCSICLSRSQANLYPYALLAVSIRHELTFARLRYSLGGDRPSQTARLTMSPHSRVRTSLYEGQYPNVDSHTAKTVCSKSPAYPVHHITKFNIRLQ